MAGRAKQGLTFLIAAQMVVATQWATTARAEMIGTGATIERRAAQADRQSLLSEVRRDEVRRELVDMGVDPAEAEARLMALSDSEVTSMVAQMEDGSAGAGIVGTLGTIFIILLVTDLLCLTRLFNFTRCVR